MKNNGEERQRVGAPEAKPLEVAQPDPLLHVGGHRSNGLHTPAAFHLPTIERFVGCLISTNKVQAMQKACHIRWGPIQPVHSEKTPNRCMVGEWIWPFTHTAKAEVLHRSIPKPPIWQMDLGPDRAKRTVRMRSSTLLLVRLMRGVYFKASRQPKGIELLHPPPFPPEGKAKK